MSYLLLRWAINTGALMLIPLLMPSIRVDGLYSALVAALALGFINALLRPLLILVTLPINILTLGLFTLVINALLFWFAASFVKGFHVAGFWPAFWGALLYSLISWAINAVLIGD